MEKNIYSGTKITHADAEDDNVELDPGNQNQQPLPSIIEPIIFIDCDKPFTLMDRIVEVRTYVNNIDADTPIVLYIVKGNDRPVDFWWYKLWQYLKEQNRKFSIVFRGVFPVGAETVGTYSDNIRVFISKDISYFNPPYDKIQTLFNERKYQFTEI